MILPIVFRNISEIEKFGLIKPNEILEIIELHLNSIGIDYIKKKNDKIVFYNSIPSGVLKYRDFLMSGVIRAKVHNDKLIITNGNWMVFLILVPLSVLYLISLTKYSTIDEHDLQIGWEFTSFFLIGNILFRIYAHYKLKIKIGEIIKAAHTAHTDLKSVRTHKI